MKYLGVVAALAFFGSAGAFGQMPPPPVPGMGGPGTGGPGMEGAGPERREMRRIIIRGDEGPGGMPHMRNGHGGIMGRGGIIEALGIDPRPVERMVKALDLTPQQLGKITEIMATVRPEMRKLARDITAETRRLRELTPSDAKYASDSAASAKKIGEMSARLVQQSADLRSKVWQVLTPEQRAKADKMRDRMQQRMKQMKERGKGPGGDRPRVFFLQDERNPS
ncbi:MAG: Spy/CpxP family protein refolding chaperone [Steroidobacteraceae bacterium]